MEKMSRERYHQYRQSHNDFDSLDESSSYEDIICLLHYAKPVNDGDDEATSAIAKPLRPILRVGMHPLSL